MLDCSTLGRRGTASRSAPVQPPEHQSLPRLAADRPQFVERHKLFPVTVSLQHHGHQSGARADHSRPGIYRLHDQRRLERRGSVEQSTGSTSPSPTDCQQHRDGGEIMLYKEEGWGGLLRAHARQLEGETPRLDFELPSGSRSTATTSSSTVAASISPSSSSTGRDRVRADGLPPGPCARAVEVRADSPPTGG